MSCSRPTSAPPSCGARESSRSVSERKVSRRSFLGGAAAGAAAFNVITAPGLAAQRRAAAGSQQTGVAVLGGGVGGLTAAHELAERGFKVTVFEPKALGGKARSIPVPGTGTGGRKDLPGEHGFRFFPGFYKNVPDTMRRIPVPGNADGAFDNLVNASQEMFVLDSGQTWMLPSFDASGLSEGIETIVSAVGLGLQVPANEVEYFLRKMLVFQTSCDARRLGEWEQTAWWDYVNAGKFSAEYQKVFGNGLTKDLVAAQGKVASTYTIGLMGLAFIYSLLAESSADIQRQSGYGNADRLLNAPTNEAWIDPWVAHLRSLGVQFVEGYGASALQMAGDDVAGVTLTNAAGQSLTVSADHYVAAMPVEKARALFDAPVRQAAPELAKLDQLSYDYMNGIQFFLDQKLDRPVKGHVAYMDSPWSLTSIEQGLFWNRDLPSSYGNGKLADILSVDISDFNTPGILYGKSAVDCSKSEIFNEVWAQLKRALNADNNTELSDAMLIDWALDPAVSFPAGQPATSSEPLLINTAGSLGDRPEAATSISNLFLAADYVRNDINLATMEGANEAGRQAANAILSRSGSSAAPASLGTLWEPSEWDAAKRTDAARYAAGQPNLLDIIPAGLPL
ncbi:MAG: FAD-dependent oxidoreductase [Solirubrobacterales bacterium]|nr:FAD-dependent oxidoreductase [Solirubrobacterales bacterium]